MLYVRVHMYVLAESLLHKSCYLWHKTEKVVPVRLGQTAGDNIGKEETFDQ